MATVQEWDAFTSDYGAKMETKRQELQQILNDPDATQAEKNRARADYAQQQRFYEMVRAKNNEIQISGIAPDTWTIPSQNANSGLYIWSGDGQTYNCNITFPLPTQAVTETWTFATSEHFDIQLTLPVRANDTNTLIPFGSLNPPDTVTGDWGVKQGTGSWAGTWRFLFTDSKNNLTSKYWEIAYETSQVYAPTMKISGTIPTVTAGSQIPCGNRQTGIPGFICGQFITVSMPGDTVTNPWDYYNSEILPDVDPDNAAYPDGYNPVPDKPDPEFPELPGETENGGPDIEPNDITGIGGGFGFLTQYAIRAADIEILGKLLWAGFRTGSQQDIDNYLMNFVYNVNADTGSLNFSDIMEFFVSLKMYPFPLANVATLTAHDHHIHVGAGYTAIGDDPNLPHFPNIIYTMDSYVGKISAGSVTLPFWFRDYRDYSMQITLYLPYCGTAELNPGDVMGGKLECDYYIDFCTGSCTAYVTCTSWDGHRFPVAKMPGQIGADVPMSATNAGRIAARIYSDRIAHAENIVGALKAVTTGAGAIMSGNYAGAARQGFSAFIDPAINEEKIKAGQMERGALAAPVLSAGGGFTAFCNPPTAYVTYRSPFYPKIDNYPDSVGEPATEQVTIDNCTGFCQFVNVNVSGITAETREKEVIIQALSAGIFI